MPFSAIAGKLLLNFPVSRYAAGASGSTYRYLGDTTLLSANKPDIGETWADGKPVQAVEIYPVQLSGLSEMLVETEQSFSSVTISTTLDETRYEIQWQPNDLPLISHPALESLADDGSDVFGWDNEPDPALRGTFKYKKVDGTTVTLTGAALKYAKLVTLGFQSFPLYTPIWSRIGTYSGTNAPGVGSIGQLDTPAGSGWPGGYEWVKVTDDAVRIGRRGKWERREAWQGYTKVYMDQDSIFV